MVVFLGADKRINRAVELLGGGIRFVAVVHPDIAGVALVFQEGIDHFLVQGGAGAELPLAFVGIRYVIDPIPQQGHLFGGETLSSVRDGLQLVFEPVPCLSFANGLKEFAVQEGAPVQVVGHGTGTVHRQGVVLHPGTFNGGETHDGNQYLVRGFVVTDGLYGALELVQHFRVTAQLPVHTGAAHRENHVLDAVFPGTGKIIQRTVLLDGNHPGFLLGQAVSGTLGAFHLFQVHHKGHGSAEHGQGVRSGRGRPTCGTASLGLLSPDRVERHVQAQFGDHGSFPDFARLAAALVAVEAVIRGKARRYACFQFDSPMLKRPPRIARKQASGPVGTLDTIVHRLRIHVEGKFHRAHVKMRVDEICTGKETLVHLVQVIADLRHYGKVAPMRRLAVVPVPGQPAGPCFDAGIGTHAPVVSNREFKADIGLRRCIP